MNVEKEKTMAKTVGAVLAIYSLMTLRVTDRGGMSIDPEELREQVIADRISLKCLVHRDGF